MKVSVYDTYVTRKDGEQMHFDILVPDHEKDIDKIYQFGKNYIKTKGQDGQVLASKECNFCHIQEATSDVQNDIKLKGFSIVEMKNCN
ncbi:MAG: DUF2024 family protein [Ginsengibacter sp.]